MTIETLQKEMIVSMKAKDKFRKETISTLIGAAKNVAIEKKCRDNITEDIVNGAILKEKKTVQDMIDTCPADRVDLLEEYKNKMAIIEEFVPKMMSEEEIRTEIGKILDTGVAKNKGAIMKVASLMFKGKADMKLVNQIVSEILK